MTAGCVRTKKIQTELEHLRATQNSKPTERFFVAALLRMTTGLRRDPRNDSGLREDQEIQTDLGYLRTTQNSKPTERFSAKVSGALKSRSATASGAPKP